MTATHHIKEQQMIKNLPAHIRNGFIFAKAACKHRWTWQHLKIWTWETINTDDVNLTFILEACLFGENKCKEDFDDCSTAHSVGTMIYISLQKYLKAKNIVSEYSQWWQWWNAVGCLNCEVRGARQ